MMNWHGLPLNPFSLPVLLAQGWWVRRVTPRLPGATGPVEGRLDGAVSALDLVVMGESPVAGIGAPTHHEAITGQTALALHQATGQTVRWLALGLSGATVQAARQRLLPQLAGRRADAVVLAFGVNDSIQQRTAQAWTADLRQLIAEVRAHVGAAPIVLSGIPPMNEFPVFPARLAAFLGQRSQLLNQATAALALELAAVTYAPMVRGLSVEDFCADRFHPSVSGYAMWGKHLAQHLIDTQDSLARPNP
jgi:lysophospholipase L1-like esterase